MSDHPAAGGEGGGAPSEIRCHRYEKREFTRLVMGLRVGPPVVALGFALYPLYRVGGRAPDYLDDLTATLDHQVHHKARFRGQVASFVASNDGPLPVLFPAGRLKYCGGEDRSLDASALVGPGGEVELPFTEVDEERFPQRRPPRPAAPCTARDARGLRLLVPRDADEDLDPYREFRDVWGPIGRSMPRVGAQGRPLGLLSAFDTVAERCGAPASIQRPAPGQVGVMVAIGGRIRAVDLFARPETLATYWKEIVASYSLSPERDGDAGVLLPHEDVPRRFLWHLYDIAVRRIPGVGLGEELHFCSDELAGAALLWEEEVVHLTACERTRPRVAGR